MLRQKKSKEKNGKKNIGKNDDAKLLLLRFFDEVCSKKDQHE